jgi:hypothetical protein
MSILMIPKNQEKKREVFGVINFPTNTRKAIKCTKTVKLVGFRKTNTAVAI